MKIRQVTTKILNLVQKQKLSPHLLKPPHSSNRKSPPTSRNLKMKMDTIVRMKIPVTPTTRGPIARITVATVSKEEVVTIMGTVKRAAINSITREVIEATEAIDKIVPGTITMKVVRKAVKANATKKIIVTSRTIDLLVSTKSASTNQKST